MDSLDYVVMFPVFCVLVQVCILGSCVLVKVCILGSCVLVKVCILDSYSQ